MKDCLLRERPHAGAGEEREKSSPEEEGLAEAREELTKTPFPHPLVLLEVSGWRIHK